MSAQNIERSALEEIVKTLEGFGLTDHLPRQGEGGDVYRARLKAMNAAMFAVFQTAQRALEPSP